MSFPLEVANALRFSHRFSEADVIAAVRALDDLGHDIRPIDVDLLRKTVAIAFAYQLTIYDAVYVALAEAVGFPLLTADEALLNEPIPPSGRSVIVCFRIAVAPKDRLAIIPSLPHMIRVAERNDSGNPWHARS